MEQNNTDGVELSRLEWNKAGQNRIAQNRGGEDKIGSEFMFLQIAVYVFVLEQA